MKMVNNKNKKITFKAIAIILIMLLLPTNVHAGPNQFHSDQEKNPKLQYNYLIFGKGYICEITINGETTKIGLLIGDMSIKNKPGWNAPEDYLFYIFDKTSNRLYTKNTLPDQFTLQYFKGLGYINYMHIGHVIDATKYFFIGKATDLM